MELKNRLSGMNALGWFTIVFSFLMVGAAGYALGTQASINTIEFSTHKHRHNKRLIPEQDQTNQPLHAQPSDIQGGSSELPPLDATNPQETPARPYGDDDLIYPYDPGYCNPRKPIAERECIY